jgi:CRP/FNR family transcriptional regulator, cyclic AMP receptor protein
MSPALKVRASAAPAAKETALLPKRAPRIFDLQSFLDSNGVVGQSTTYADDALIYTQGDVAADVLYIQEGAVKLTVLSKRGKEAVVGILAKGDFFGEGCLAGQPFRMASASAMNATRVLAVKKPKMVEMLRTKPALATRLLSHVLARNIRIEEDLTDQLFNSSEKRLARALLLLAHYGKKEQLLHLPKISQETLAEMVGTTRSRINFFMNKFRKLGFIDYNGTITVNTSLLTILLSD